MKRLFLTLCMMLSILIVYAMNTEKQFRKLIENYDVPVEARMLDSIDASAFWSVMLENNEQHRKFIKDMQKNRGAEKETLQKISELQRFYPEYDETIVESMQGFCDTLLINMGIDRLNLNCSLHVVDATEANAFTALTEDGFAMCVTTGLMDKKGVTYEILMGYVAHEFAHGVLQHQARSFYADAKKRRKNELITGIAIGALGVAVGVGAYNAIATGVLPVYGVEYFPVFADNIDTSMQMSTLRYSFKYSREQEYEADLAAYRFLQHLGHGEAFINGLKILGTSYDDAYSAYSDHPAITDRIMFLKYVGRHPELYNLKNEKLRMKELRRSSVQDPQQYP